MLTGFWAARMRVDRLSPLADLMQRASSGQNNTPTAARPRKRIETQRGMAGTQADRLFRFVDLLQHTSSEGNNSATLVAPT
jgi:HAMP domain-containing protein